MKAKSLLPGVIYTEDEEKQVHNLEEKLELYALMVSASSSIKNIFDKNQLYERNRALHKGSVVFVPDDRVDTAMLQSVALLTLATFLQPKALVKVAVEQALRIENVIEKLLKRVTSVASVNFRSLADGAETVEEKKKILIVNFIALLELLRNGGISVNQEIDGGEIQIQKLGE